MGLSASSADASFKEQPSERHEATLYYFGGRGLADQLRWMLAATEVPFTQKIISQRQQFERMSSQLPFGQLPLLQMDGLEIVQSQAAVRYLARRGGIGGRTEGEVLKCDLIAEAVRDLLGLLCAAPFKRMTRTRTRTKPDATPSEEQQQQQEEPSEEWAAHRQLMADKWAFSGARFEGILLRQQQQQQQRSTSSEEQQEQGEQGEEQKVYLVGNALTYADVLVAHAVTWFVEELGAAAVIADMPLLVQLQNQVISLPGVRAFIQSKLYFPIGDQRYCDQVRRVLNRDI